MFTASLRRERMKANLQRLKEKEIRVVKERRELKFKQKAIRQVQEVQKGYQKFNVNKFVIMPLDDILKKKHQLLLAKEQNEAAKRL